MSRSVLVLSLVAASFCCNVALCEKTTVLQEARAAEEKSDYRKAQRLCEEYLKAQSIISVVRTFRRRGS
jgi:hypothetical protein